MSGHKCARCTLPITTQQAEDYQTHCTKCGANLYDRFCRICWSVWSEDVADDLCQTCENRAKKDGD